MSIHNTGCGMIANETVEDFNVLNLDSGRWVYIPAGRQVSFNGEIFPWCSNPDEIQRHAFRFFHGQIQPPGPGGEPQFYMFQRWPAPNIVHWTPDPESGVGGGINFPGTPAGAPESGMVRVRIIMHLTPPPSGTPVTVRVF